MAEPTPTAADLVAFRKHLAREIAAGPRDREGLQQKYGEVWDHLEVAKAFRITAFAAPFCWAIRLSDGARGTLLFTHLPRFYFSFEPD